MKIFENRSGLPEIRKKNNSDNVQAEKCLQ